MNDHKMGDVPHQQRMLRTPPWPLPDVRIDDVLRQLAQDGSWGHYDGPHSQQLIEAFSRYQDVEFVYLCASGTFAVELALRGLGIGAGDEVVLAAYDFPGNFRAIEAIGATPVLIDIEADTYGLDPRRLPDACRSSNVRAVIVSHLHGGLADMTTICQFAREARIAVIEDACQAVGAVVQGRKAGSWGDVGILSFGGSKLLTAGRGGAILTRRPDVVQRAKIVCERGNHAFPLSEMQAAVLLPQLARLDTLNQLRRARAAMLRDSLRDVAELLAPISDGNRGLASHYKLAWCVRSPQPAARSLLLEAVWKIGADLGEGFRGFARRGEGRCRTIGSLPHSRAAAERTVLLHHPLLLTDEPQHLEWLASTIRAALQA